MIAKIISVLLLLFSIAIIDKILILIFVAPWLLLLLIPLFIWQIAVWTAVESDYLYRDQK